MAYVISDSCVSCGTCEPECPVGAISQGDSQFQIDAGMKAGFDMVQKLNELERAEKENEAEKASE